MQLGRFELKILACTAFAFLLAASLFIGNHFDLPPSKAVAVLCAILSPFAYGAGYWFAQRWFTRIGMALGYVAILMWFVTPELFTLNPGR